MSLYRSSLLPIVGSFLVAYFQYSGSARLRFAATHFVLNYLNRSTIYWAQTAIFLTCLALLSPQVASVFVHSTFRKKYLPRQERPIVVLLK